MTISLNGFAPTFSLFPDGEYNVTVSKSLVQTLTNTIEIVWKFESNEELIQLGILLNLLSSYNSGKEKVRAHVLIPFFPYSRMDRHEEGKHNSFSLEQFMSMLPKSTDSLEVGYETIDVHNPQVFHDISSKILGTRFSNIDFMIPLLLSNTGHEFTKEPLLVFPDKGSFARYSEIFDDSWNYVIGSKNRDFETHKITSYDLVGEIDFEDYDEAIIVDDVISYGNTFIKLLDSLEENGIKSSYLLTSHAENSLWKGDLLSHSGLKKVITTDSLTTFTSSLNQKVKVLSFEELLNQEATI